MRALKLSALCMFALLPAETAIAENGVFDTLLAHCGKAFQGEVTRYNDGDDGWRQASIVMHIRDCNEQQIKVPLHVGEDHSRVWIVSKTEGGVRLKHDHRHDDGKPDAVTMYGGDTVAGADPGASRLSFPVDQESIDMFNANGLTASVVNVWHVAVEGSVFSYNLTRPNRDFKVDFDLTKPVALPPAAWDLVKN